MQGNKKNAKQKDKTIKEPRYNEKQAFITHLSSENGISKLLNTFRALKKASEEKFENVEILKDESITENANVDSDLPNKRCKKIDDAATEILDVFKAWVDEFPCRKFLKMSYFEIFSRIEKYCEEKEIAEMFDYLF